MTDQELDSILLTGFIPTGEDGYYIKVDRIWFVSPYPDNDSSCRVYYNNNDYIKAEMTSNKMMELMVRCRQLREEYEDFRSKNLK